MYKYECDHTTGNMDIGKNHVLLTFVLLNEAQVQHEASIHYNLAVSREIERSRTKKRRRPRHFWVRSWLTEDERQEHSQFYHLVQKLKIEQPNNID